MVTQLLFSSSHPSSLNGSFYSFHVGHRIQLELACSSTVSALYCALHIPLLVAVKRPHGGERLCFKSTALLRDANPFVRCLQRLYVCIHRTRSSFAILDDALRVSNRLFRTAYFGAPFSDVSSGLLIHYLHEYASPFFASRGLSITGAVLSFESTGLFCLLPIIITGTPVLSC